MLNQLNNYATENHQHSLLGVYNFICSTMTIQEVAVPGCRAFSVIFSSKRQPITVVRATNRDGEKFWTTIPQNISRQGEAEGVGKLIQEYLKNN